MSHGEQIFATAVNCMDGRAVGAVGNFMKNTHHTDFVDNITEPGMDGLIGKMTEDQIAYLKKKLSISIVHHGSRIVAVVGHADCAGNPVDADAHRVCIADGVEVVKKLVGEIDATLPVETIGLWVHEAENHEWVAEKI